MLARVNIMSSQQAQYLLAANHCGRTRCSHCKWPNWRLRKIATMALLYGLLCYASPANASGKAMKLMQTHTLFGPSQLIVAHQGVRIENEGRLRFKLVARAPDWQVTVFRDDDKVFITESLREFEDSGLVSGMVLEKEPRTLGLEDPHRITTFKFLGKELVRLTAARKTVKFMPLNGIPEQAERIIYAAYKLPTGGGIPVGYIMTRTGTDYFTGSNQKGRMEVMLSTEKITDIPITAEMFRSPRAYKRAKSVREVVAGSSTRRKDADYQTLFKD